MASSTDETQPLLPQDGSGRGVDQFPDAAIDSDAGSEASCGAEFDPLGGDPDDPRNWPSSFKWGIVLLLACMAFTVTFTCISVVPNASHIVDELDGRGGSPDNNNNKAATVLLVTIWELGEAAGPLVIAPLSETARWGRYGVLNGATLLFVAATAAAALAPSTAFFILARGLTGMAVATNVLSPAIVGDMFAPAQRGSAMALVQLAPLIGGAVGPAIGGAVAGSWGWQSVLWLSLVPASVCELLFLFAFRETYPPAILYRRMRQQQGRQEQQQSQPADFVVAVSNPSANSLVNDPANSPAATSAKPSSLRHMRDAVLRPAVVLADSIVLLLLSVFGSVAFAYFYTMAVSLPNILEIEYGLSPAETGSAFLSFSIGAAFSVLICNQALDRIYVFMSKANSHTAGPDDNLHRLGQPEFRLPLTCICAFILPISVAAYGWAAEYHAPLAWLLATIAMMGASLMLTFIPLAAYVVDAFGLYAASAMTGLIVLRCLCGTFLPLAVAPLVDSFGYGWGFTVLGGFCLVLAPIPLLVLRYGKRWRQWSKYTRDA